MSRRISIMLNALLPALILLASLCVNPARPIHVLASASYTAPRPAMPYMRPIRAIRSITVTAIPYQVRAGDSLSSIAQQYYRSAAKWPAIYWANRNTIRWADLIYPGEYLSIPASSAFSWRAVPMSPAAVQVEVAYSAPIHNASRSAAPSGSFAISSGFQSCVVARESGGNAQVMNSTGHYGLYQFSYSTWTSHGGAPGDFGHASAAEQTQVFWNTVHADGTSDWAPYDGC